MKWTINREEWDKTKEEEKIENIRIKEEESGYEVHLLTLGAIINRVLIPDKTGNIEDIHYGCANYEEYIKNNAYQGAMIGRVASLIAFGRIEIEGKTYELSKNMLGVHTQHGGFKGFDKKIWTVKSIETINDEEGVKISFTTISRDGEEGFPGELTIDLTYTIKKFQIEWEIRATTNKTTILNMTNHAYWNLEGLYKSIENHSLTLYTDYYLHLNLPRFILQTLAAKMHLGKRKKAPFSIRSIKELEKKGIKKGEKLLLKKILKEFGDLDHNFIRTLQEDKELTKIVEVCVENKGRKMELWTTEPAIVVFSGNNMENLTSFHKPTHKHDAFSLEPLKPTNSIQLPEFKEMLIVTPEKPYHTKTLIKFIIEEK